MTKTKRLRPLTKYRRYEHVYRIYPASATHYDFIGEVRVQKVVEKFSPFMKFSDMYGSFENWLAKQTKKESFYVKNIIRGHGKYPMATLSQLVYKPRTEYGEKKVSEAIKINIPNEEDLKWELRQLADDILVTI